MNKDIERIINMTNALTQHGKAAGSTSERIAAAFIINDMRHLPSDYDNVVDAWARLDNWQRYVYLIREDYAHLLLAPNTH